MTIDQPSDTQALRRLWKQAFGDSDAFLDSFFSVGYSCDRCRQLSLDSQLAAALYWFDCSFSGKPVAYVYAVATDAAFQGQGLCRALMAEGKWKQAMEQLTAMEDNDTAEALAEQCAEALVRQA